MKDEVTFTFTLNLLFHCEMLRTESSKLSFVSTTFFLLVAWPEGYCQASSLSPYLADPTRILVFGLKLACN